MGAQPSGGLAQAPETEVVQRYPALPGNSKLLAAGGDWATSAAQ